MQAGMGKPWLKLFRTVSFHLQFPRTIPPEQKQDILEFGLGDLGLPPDDTFFVCCVGPWRVQFRLLWAELVTRA